MLKECVEYCILGVKKGDSSQEGDSVQPGEQVKRIGVLLAFGKHTHDHHDQRSSSKEVVVELDLLGPD